MEQEPVRTKPKWLRKMERESWQPELIISGAAILGSLQLPGLIEQFEYYCLLNFDRDTLFICYIAVIYWRLVALGLIFTFIFHFIVRALWIGLVGLNSVYPGGFRTNNKFSRHYQERMREEYGDIDGFIQSLDRLGSGIFGIAFGIAGVFVNFGLVTVLFIFIHSWLIGYGLEQRQIWVAIGCLLLPLFLASVLTMVSHLERFRDTAFVRKYQWPAAMFISRLTYPVARRYITTSTNLVTSYYADNKGFGFYYIAGLALIIIIGTSSMLANDNISFFIDAVYHRMADDPTRAPDAFTTESTYEGIYFQPVIGRTEGEPDARGMTVWVPLPEREIAFLESTCSVAEVDDDLPRGERRRLNRERTLACAQEYLEISLNDEKMTVDLKRQYRTNEAGEQFGVLAYLPDPPLRKGVNTLLVVAQYPEEDSGEPRRSYVPFYH
ncbi:hypothetical protein [Lewinella sp. IMCC34191]|uniref:hypothetical protein n=1 Tax=Lewinella sp. IMCC34191 TaxID=2259172 RepID=UPI000E21C251|nr:hypothetical protein [Lewinella sp. IMCC34191]